MEPNLAVAVLDGKELYHHLWQVLAYVAGQAADRLCLLRPLPRVPHS